MKLKLSLALISKQKQNQVTGARCQGNSMQIQIKKQMINFNFQIL